MNNGARPSKLNITVETLPCFSASLLCSGITPVTRVNVSGFAEGARSKLTLSIVGKCGDTEFLHRADFERVCLCPDSYNLKAPGSCAFDLSFDFFSFDTAFLTSLDKECLADIYVLVAFGTDSASAKTSIKLLPGDVWQGLEAEPSALCTFVMPYDDRISGITQSIDRELPDGEKLESLFRALKSCNIIYSRPAGYSANACQRIRTPDDMFTGSSTLATPLELAVVFCSCAERCGFNSSILFVRGAAGNVTALCGIQSGNDFEMTPVFEDKQKLCELISFGELLIVDPSVFAAAQNADFALACDNTAQGFLDGGFELVCMVSVSAARKSGVSPMFRISDGESVKPAEESNVKSGISALYSSLRSSPVMKYLSGLQNGRYEEIPLLLTNFDEVLCDSTESYRLCPMEFNVDLGDFATLDKDFSSVLTAGKPVQKFSASEKDVMQTRFERFRKRIGEIDGLVSSLGEERLYETASHMAFGKSGERAYGVFGYVKIADKLTELVRFAPILLVPSEVKYENGAYYYKQCAKPIVNKVLLRNVLNDAHLPYDSFMKNLMPTQPREIFDLFENVREALSETDDRHSYEIVREAHIIYADLSDYILWSDIALCRKKLADSRTVSGIFGKKASPHSNRNDSYIPMLPLYDSQTKAVCTNEDAVLDGRSAKEKTDAVICAVARQITEGKTVLVAADDGETAEYIYKALCGAGLADQSCLAGETEEAGYFIRRIKQLLAKYENAPEDNLADNPKDLAPVRETLVSYHEKLNKPHKMGMSLQEAICSYFSANDGSENMRELEIDESVFEGADESRLDSLFNDAGLLIMGARRLCESSGLPKYSPISAHPLYHTKPESPLSEENERSVRELISKALPVLSDYRDTFTDISDILGIDTSEIRDLDSAKALNELYKLILSAREVDIPEDFIESDIEVFSRKVNRLSAMKLRREAIEFKLNFFSPEIFEDIETLLTGDKYEDSEKGFLKKFIHKKNDQDLLLQYVKPENKAAFMQKPTEEIYKLLYEYKAYIKALRADDNSTESLGNSYQLAVIASNAGELIDRIAGENPADRCRRLSNVFRLISIIPVDSALARRMTVARAKFAELYSGDEAVLDGLSALLGIDFAELSFESGILSFDGLGKYLNGVNTKLDVTDKWIVWLKASDEIRKTLPSFVDFIELHGAVGNVDRIFAKSLLLPAARKICSDSISDDEFAAVGAAKEKYMLLLNKASEISKSNVSVSFAQSVRHCAETTGADSLDKYESSSLYELLEKQRPLCSKLLPCIVISADNLTRDIPAQVMFDLVITCDAKNDGMKLLPALSFGKKALAVNMSAAGMSELCKKLKDGGIDTLTADKYYSNKNLQLFSWINSENRNEGAFLTNPLEKSNVEIVRMNGIFERDEGRINRTESELAVSKVIELLSVCAGDTVAVTAFTRQQCEYIERVANVLCKKSGVLSKAMHEGKVVFCTPDKLFAHEYDSIVVSACFCPDRNGRAGWDMGFASCGSSEAMPQVYYNISDRGFRKMYLITSLNVKDSRVLRRTGNSVKLFNSLCEFLSDGRIPVSLTDTDSTSGLSMVPGILDAVGAENSRVIPCRGKNAVGAQMMTFDNRKPLAVFADNDGYGNLHDELFVRASLEKSGFETMTVSPVGFAGSDNQALLSAFRSEKAQERTV